MFLARIASLLQWKKPFSKAKRRQRRPRGGDDFVAPEITLDLMIEILTRLPAISLMRFKCVSKSWYCLIHSRYFTNRYLTVESPIRSPRLYVSFMEHVDCDSMEFCYNPGKSLLVSFSSSSTKASNGNPFWGRLRLERHQIPNSVESFHKDMRMLGMGGHDMFVLRGLILYKVCRKAFIYNPNTRQSLTLPAVESKIFAQERPLKNVYFYFGHDPLLDQYKVPCTVLIFSTDLERITSEHWVFVLEVGGFSKRIEFNQPHDPTNDVGLCIDGDIYYLANTSMTLDTVVSFDIRSEEFNMIKAPHDVSELVDHEFVEFIEYCGGKPTILDYTNLGQKGMVELWVLEDGGKWLKKSLVLKACQMHLVDKEVEFMVGGTTRKGEVILAPCEGKSISPYYNILYYNLQKNDMRKVKIRGLPNPWWFIKPYFDLKLMDKGESIINLEI